MNSLGFDVFREQWMGDVRSANLPQAEIERRFAHKIFTQWLDLPDNSDDLIYCSGTDDGIDLAYLERREPDGENPAVNTWYLVQSKSGSAFHGNSTLRQEGEKVIKTLTADMRSSSEAAESFTPLIHRFLAKADPLGNDRLVLIFATELPLNEGERRALDELRARGREHLGNIFDVESISIETIYLNQSEEPLSAVSPPIRVPIEATMANSGRDLMVGSIPLTKIYEFLKNYRAQTENLDQLYEKNVRRFLGGRGKVNKGMQATLNDNPAQFGLYNNGITIVVKDFAPLSHSTYLLTEPFIVNGCQTTRTIWEVFSQKLESGGKDSNENLQAWKDKARDGVVIAKVVRVGNFGEQLLQNITRFTNSQNAVKDKDFITLYEGFHNWKNEMASKYEIFLEIQRGGWDSQQAWQNQNSGKYQFSEFANAFDLLKVYGSGWLRESGTAFGSNKSFVPGGSLYQQIVERTEDPFGVDDLYGSYLLQKAADQFDFGRGSSKASRRQTRYLFYMIVIDLFRDVLLRAGRASSAKNLTRALIQLHRAGETGSIQALLDTAVGVVDEYLTQGEEYSVFSEPSFKERNNDLGGFLKWEQLGKGDHTPSLTNLMAITKRTMGRGNPSPRDLITSAIR